MIILAKLLSNNISRHSRLLPINSTFKHNRNSVVFAPRWLSSQKITDKLSFYTEKPRQIVNDTKTLRLRQQEANVNLVILLSWAQARTKDVEKFCETYTNLGFDVLVVKTNVWHVLQPERGSMLAVDIVKFLTNNDCYRQVLIHGFSVGGYIWGACLVHLHGSPQLVSVTERIKSQVWDSIVGMKEIPIGVSKTAFLTNDFMQKTAERFLLNYLQFRRNDAENYYIPSESHFHHKAIPVPALVFSSKTDFIGTEEKARKIAEDFQTQNIATTLKCFDRSPHVGHFKNHKDDYLRHLINHLRLCKLM